MKELEHLGINLLAVIWVTSAALSVRVELSLRGLSAIDHGIVKKVVRTSSSLVRLPGVTLQAAIGVLFGRLHHFELLEEELQLSAEELVLVLVEFVEVELLHGKLALEKANKLNFHTPHLGVALAVGLRASVQHFLHFVLDVEALVVLLEDVLHVLVRNPGMTRLRTPLQLLAAFQGFLDA